MEKIITLQIDFDANLKLEIKKKYPETVDYKILSQSLDARNAPKGRKPLYIYRLELIEKEQTFIDNTIKLPIKKKLKLKNKPIIVGSGPAGLFAALSLLEAGVPSLIFERGQQANQRMLSIAKFWRYGELDTSSNVCFGEGGAGLFSDGKLITRIKSPYVKYVMQTLVKFGAPDEVAYLKNPHLGSNKIRKLISSISTYLKQNGCQFFFETTVSELLIDTNSRVQKVIGVKIEDGREFRSDNVILSIGHSARDTYSMLMSKNVEVKAKNFSVGVRVEHPRKQFDCLQYGKYTKLLEKTHGASFYRLSNFNKKNNLGTYSFCMCPGGYVLSSGTEKNGIVTNGMSNFKRNSPWSNAAIVVEVHEGKHFNGVLEALDFQKNIERLAFEASSKSKNKQKLPAQRLKDFCQDKISANLPKTSCPSGVFSYPIKELFPSFVTKNLKEAFANFDRKIKGFVSNDALIIAPETRTSSALKITRNKDTFESINTIGLYPCGEGAGYAGGITSSAVDGINIALSIITKESNN